MMTYIIQSNDEQIAQYERNYSYAKRLLLRLGSDYHIIAIKGQYYGEGFHLYKLTLNNGKFKREKLR